MAPADIDETLRADESPEPFARRMAAAKAELVARDRPDACVIGADTVVALDGTVFGKPRDPDDAEAILARLSGRTHRVLTAVAVGNAQRMAQALSISAVTFRELSTEEIRRYVRSGEPMDKAGAYGIQGRAAMFIARVEGSPSGIVGLPLCETALLLRDFA